MERFLFHGTCSMEIVFDVSDDVSQNVEFVGGCSGNTQGISRLLKGMKVDDAIERLDGIRCGFRATSCPDQFAKALKEYKKKNAAG